MNTLEEIKQRAVEFARENIAPRHDLLEAETFPHDIWSAMGQAGLMGIAIDPRFGGSGLDFAGLAETCEAFAEASACPGLTMSWLGHNLMGRLLIQNVGTPEQQEVWLPRIASGEVTPAVAISEPGAGAHPKRMTATADKQGDEYLLKGMKAFVTNGPIAGVFVTVMMTGSRGGRKEFTAFLVPSNAEGISILPMDPPINFLHPSPHCRVKFDNVSVPESAIIGGLGNGFEVISRRVRLVEDIVGLSSLVGALGAQINIIVNVMEKNRDRLDEAAFVTLGELIAKRHGLSAIASQAVASLEGDGNNDQAAAFRPFMRIIQDDINHMKQDLMAKFPRHFDILSRDIVKSLDIARAAHTIQASKRGAAYLAMRK